MPIDNSNLPKFPNDQFVHRSDLRRVTDALEKLSRDFANIYPMGGTNLQNSDFFIEMWPGIVKSNAGTGGNTAQYNVQAAVTKEGLTPSQQWKCRVDTMTGLAETVVATNLFELSASQMPVGTNAVASGQAVMVFAFCNRGGNGSNSETLYVFSHLPSVGYPCKITAVDAAAQYTATIYSGTTTAVSGTALSMPAGLTAGATVTVCNLDENALTGNRLAIGSWVYAYPTSSPTVFWTHGGVGSRSTPKSLPYSDPTSTTADTATWDRDTDGVALNLTDPRIVWDPDALLLHVFTRKKYYDARGFLYHVDGEVDAPVTFTNCTAGS